MTYQRFEDLPVWQNAIRLAEGCEDSLIAAKPDSVRLLEPSPHDIGNAITSGSTYMGARAVRIGIPIQRVVLL